MTQQAFNQATAAAVSTMLKDHLQNFPSGDFDLETGKVTGTPQELTITVKIRHKGTKSSDQLLLETYADVYSLDLEKSAQIRGVGSCKLVGYRPQNPKLP